MPLEMPKAPMTKSTPPELLQRIAASARAGRLDEAALLVAEVQPDHADDPVLAALGGAIELHRGQFERAVPLLQIAHRHHPQDLIVRGNLAESLYRTGQNAAALMLCDAASVAGDPSFRLARLGAFLAQGAEEFDTAIALYRLIVARFPDDWSSWNNLGNALSETGQDAEAIKALDKAIEFAPESQPIRVNLANALIESGDGDRAQELLRKAASDVPDDPTPLLSLFGMYQKLGWEVDAYAAITEAARRAPQDAGIQSDLGQEASKHNEYAIAEQAFETALSIDPGLGHTYVGLASLYERTNREVELDPLIERARSNSVDAASISFIEALLFKRANNFDAAFAALEAAGDVIIPGRMFHLRGVMLDRLGRHDDAFAAFTAMNQYWLDDPSKPQDRAAQFRDVIVRDMALSTPDWISSWSPPPAPDGRNSPIFLLGFPRSGTTLLDTMLMREPRVVVLEEEPFLAEMETALGGPEAFATLDQAALRRGRDLYFEQVAKTIDLKADTILVDKHPLHLNKVPAIKRVFPDARFVLALRHPCDVLLSCYLTNFRINNAMANFLDLEDAATMYDLTFSNWEQAREMFALPVGTVVYERLVEDPARELRPLFAWLGLDWPGDDVDHRDAARARGLVKTASYAQVTEPIYQRATGRWHRYADHLEPLFDRLRPWAERFGYSLEDGRIPPWPDEASAR